MKQWLRYLAPAGGALVLALGAVSSSRASSHGQDVELLVQDDEACKVVAGAGGGDVLCAAAGATVVGFRDQPSGVACPAGGRAVSWGADTNGNRLLDPSELEGSTYVCVHDSPAHRASRAMVVRTPLPKGNGHCPNGGTLVQSGIDRDGDGALDGNEIDRGTFACHRFGGPALDAFVDVTDEPAGTRCARGGKRVVMGHEGERPRISYVCDGV